MPGITLAEIDGALPPANGRLPAVLYDAAGVAVDVAALIAANAGQRWVAGAWVTRPDLVASGVAFVSSGEFSLPRPTVAHTQVHCEVSYDLPRIGSEYSIVETYTEVFNAAATSPGYGTSLVTPIQTVREQPVVGRRAVFSLLGVGQSYSADTFSVRLYARHSAAAMPARTLTNVRARILYQPL